MLHETLAREVHKRGWKIVDDEDCDFVIRLDKDPMVISSQGILYVRASYEVQHMLDDLAPGKYITKLVFWPLRQDFALVFCYRNDE